jgi:hypothetical protein
MVLHAVANNRFCVNMSGNYSTASGYQTMLIPAEPHIYMGQVRPISVENAYLENTPLRAHA